MTEPPRTDPEATGDPGATAVRDRGESGEGELAMFLEHDQRVLDAARPLPRAQLSATASVALWALRVFVIVLAGMVIYAFAVQVAG